MDVDLVDCTNRIREHASRKFNNFADLLCEWRYYYVQVDGLSDQMTHFEEHYVTVSLTT
jgi:hypothetical protein